MNALITGGAGFIGSHIADELLHAGHQVVIVDDMSNGREENVPQGVRFFYRQSILCNDLEGDNYLLEQIARDHSIDIIFHEAAQPSLRKSIEQPEEDARINILGTLRVIQVAKAINAHLVFASTSAVYAPNTQIPFYENDFNLRPNLPYGIAKLSAEMYIQNLGVSHTILRYGNVYGPRQVPIGENQLIPHCIRFLKGQEPDFAINGDGEQMRDFVYVKDIARANVSIGGLKMPGVFNCGTGKGTTVNQVCNTLARIAGKDDIKFPHREAKQGEARHSILETHNVLQTGWRAKTSLQEGLQQTWDWYANHH